GAIRTFVHPRGFALAPRRITVSTVGVVPKLEPLLAGTRVNLAVSLHAPTDALRDELVPLNRRYPLAVLLGALRASP
ncbi:MAG: 23S rRNA (adenine(2503)-C(2))-methyltransferase RlmN, partial [Gemmatimonadetes bacterium]|nr:23S rRNA (adenine(2503)-C(2))-methyltransferase RlmN [Gemmatimonadota bacterium]